MTKPLKVPNTYEGTIIGMEAQKNRILAILRHRKGKNKAITARALSKKSRIPEREVRRIISELVKGEKLLIASSVHRPYGFYMIRNIYELKECLGQYYSRIKTLKDRASSLYKSGLKRFSKQIQGEFNFYG